MLVGITAYDLKNNQILAFNIQSLASFVKAQSIQKEEGLYDVVKYLFDRTLSENMELRSYLPAPIDSPYYTALPWISYSVLSLPKLDEQIGNPADNISIANFFIFGYPSLPTEGRSFVFSNFSIDKEGHAICIFNLNKMSKQVKYTLRFDKSSGQPLVHLDFSFYEGPSILKKSTDIMSGCLLE